MVWTPSDGVSNGGGMTGSGLQKLAFFLLLALILYASVTAAGA
jgi:hypothetical protein